MTAREINIIANMTFHISGGFITFSIPPLSYRQIEETPMRVSMSADAPVLRIRNQQFLRMVWRTQAIRAAGEVALRQIRSGDVPCFPEAGLVGECQHR